MPELIPCAAGTSFSEAVATLTRCKKVITAVWDGIDWIGDFCMWNAEGDEVMHWKFLLPLPDLPEEEENVTEPN